MLSQYFYSHQKLFVTMIFNRNLKVACVSYSLWFMQIRVCFFEKQRKLIGDVCTQVLTYKL